MERFVAQAQALGGNATCDGPATRAARAALQATLKPPVTRRRRIAAPLLLVIALLLPLALVLRAFPPAELLADLRTATGEQRTQVLADGTRLSLGSGSAVNVGLAPGLRRLELLNGEILVDVAKDAARPFVVETAHGRIRALGTRFLVRRDAGSTLLTMLESTTAVTAGGQTAGEVHVDAGGQVRLSARGVERLADVHTGMAGDAFEHQRLLVQDRPLPEVLDELARHRRGVIRYERERLAGIRVSAVLPLDDTDRALQLLVDSFPQLRVRTATAWVVLVDTAR